MTEAASDSEREAVAIVGMAGRFPGADSLDEFWEIIRTGRETISRFDLQDLDPSVPTTLREDARYIRARGVLKGAEDFDSGFFSMSQREAELMDPQQRLFLELAWEALEQAGCNPADTKHAIAVFGGCGLNTYLSRHLMAHPGLVQSEGEHRVSLANAPDYIATRTAYKLNLRGPAISLYTGCSLSLVAVSMATESLLSYQADLALAGGTFVECPQRTGYLYQEGEICSADGHCRPFDAAATGTVFSNGGGIVALKRLSEARRDGDFIWAVIRGTGMNNDGAGKVSFTAPSVQGQAEAIMLAHANAGIEARSIGYVETHGTGTPVGDPIEIEALNLAFRATTADRAFCRIGAVKANIGHLDAAAGVAGLIKTALVLHHRLVPGCTNFDAPNPRINFDATPFTVPRDASVWDQDAGPRRAGVSSFGVGGTNVHVVLEEAPPREESEAHPSPELLVISARTLAGLEQQRERLAAFLDDRAGRDLGAVAGTLQAGRQALRFRHAVAASTASEAARLLRQDADPQHRAPATDARPEIVFLFPAQGSQYPGMGYGLYRSEPAYRDCIDELNALFRPLLGVALTTLLRPAESSDERAQEALRQTAFTQPAVFATNLAAARLWESWGIRPDVLVGHSLGEIVAATVSGILTLTDAVRFVAERGRLMQAQPPGAMLSVNLAESELAPMLEAPVELSAVNGPSHSVAGGPVESIERLREELSRRNVPCQVIKTSHAYHTAMMQGAVAPLVSFLREVSFGAPAIPIVSTVSGRLIGRDDMRTPEYWGRQLREPVRFGPAIREVVQVPGRILLEMGPGTTLTQLARLNIPLAHTARAYNTLRHPRDNRDDLECSLSALGCVWCSGYEVDWARLRGGRSRRIVPVPSSPFVRTRCWIDAPRTDGRAPASPAPRGPADDSAEDDRPREPARGGSGAGPGATPAAPAEAPPASEQERLERIVARIWTRLLGASHISAGDNFFSLGGDSLLAARLAVELERACGIRLPLAALIQAPTVTQMARLVASRNESHAWKCLVRVRQEGAKRPLFILHSHGGNILEYHPLIQRLDADRPIYAVQSIGLDGSPIGSPSIEDLVQRYLPEIRAVAPDGPYLLAGFCFGGDLAFEMAQQLTRAGAEVSLLVMIHAATWKYPVAKTGSTRVAKLAHKAAYRLALEWDLLRRDHSGWRLRHVTSRVRRILDLTGVRIEAMLDRLPQGSRLRPKRHSMIHSLEQLASTMDRAWESYRPSPYSGRVLFIHARRKLGGIEPDDLLGWGDYLAGATEVVEVDGFRQTMLDGAYVDAVAAPIREALRSLD